MDVIPAFVDETGVLTTAIKEQPVYGIGLLLVHDPARVTDSSIRCISTLRLAGRNNVPS